MKGNDDKYSHEVTSLKKDIVKLKKENEKLKKQIDQVKSSKSLYMLHITKRLAHNELCIEETKYYSRKQDARTDLEHDYFEWCGERLVNNNDDVVWRIGGNGDHERFIRLEIVKLNLVC